MNQEKILKIIKGLNTFSLDDIVMMTDIKEAEVKSVLKKLIQEEKIIHINDDEYRFSNKSFSKKITLRLVDRPDTKIIKNNNILFVQAAEYFLINHASVNCTPSSFKTYISINKTHLVPFFGKIELKNITQNDIKEFIELKQKEGLTNKRLSNCVTLFGNMFKKFKEWEFISESPYNGIINVKFIKEPKIKVLNESEVKSLLNAAKNKYPSFYPLILLILSTGLKKGEILALKKEDIDLKNRKISINKTLYEGELLIPKVKTVIRQVDIPENIINKLNKVIKNKEESDFAFYDISLSHFTTGKHIRENLADLLKQLKLQRIAFNDLRHTYAYNFLQQGMSIDYLHKQLGDYLIQATMDKYKDFIPARS